MKLSKYIKELEEKLKNYGDLEVVYSVDDEGNSFNEVYFSPSIGHYRSEDKEWDTQEDIFERNDEEEEDAEHEERKPELIHVNAICIN